MIKYELNRLYQKIYLVRYWGLGIQFCWIAIYGYLKKKNKLIKLKVNKFYIQLHTSIQLQ